MSAFMVPATHINAMVNAAHHYGRLADRYYMRADDQHLATMLIAQNRASINARYPDTKDNRESEPGAHVEDTIEITPMRRMPTRIEAWQLINCYEYQACETDDWPTTRAKRFCDAFRRALVESLPSYAEQAAGAPYVWETL